MKRVIRVAAYLAAFVTVFAFGGCEKEDTSSCDWESEYNVYMQKIDAFSASPTKTNCNALKSSAKTLLNKLGNCSDGASVRDALKQWDSLDCSGF